MNITKDQLTALCPRTAIGINFFAEDNIFIINWFKTLWTRVGIILYKIKFNPLVFQITLIIIKTSKWNLIYSYPITIFSKTGSTNKFIIFYGKSWISFNGY